MDQEEIVQLTRTEFWEELGFDPEDFRQKSFYKRNPPITKFGGYMQMISQKMCVMVNAKHPIVFHPTESIVLLDHPTCSGHRPNFVATPSNDKKYQWSDVEATIVIHSEGISLTDGFRQSMAYADLLLQARPDRVSTPGMYVDDAGVILFLYSSTKTKRTEQLELKRDADMQLLYAFVRRLYEPHPRMVDPTIRKDKNSEDQSVFDIQLNFPSSPPIVCVGYKILDASASAGQRTHIFSNENSPTKVNGQPVFVIKDQYRRRRRSRFEEHDIIKHIHREGEIPGTIRIAHAEEVVRDDGSPVCSDEHYKRRMCMLDFGTHVMDLETPKEVLKAIYDLLEVTRFIYFNRQVLHRDISEGNVLFKKQPVNSELVENVEKQPSVTAPPSAQRDKAKPQLCFIEHFLNSSVSPSETSLLLVDFDSGEILDQNRRLCHAGTIQFMAKAVRLGKPHGMLGEPIMYKNVPKLTEKARSAYEDAHPDRLTRFPDCTPRHIVDVGVADLTKFRHELYHDAESAFWLLMRWAFLAFPAGRAPTEIDAGDWYSLTNTKRDNRHLCFNPGFLDPGYTALEDLLIDLGLILQRDIHWATEEPYIHADFVHEALQRHLLNFIVENQDEEFMNLRKASVFRQLEASGIAYVVSHIDPQIEKLRTRSSYSRMAGTRPSPLSSVSEYDLPSPPSPPSGRPCTRSMTSGSIAPLSGPVTQNASVLNAALRGASNMRMQSSKSSNLKHPREAESKEPRAGSSKKAKKGKKPQTETALT